MQTQDGEWIKGQFILESLSKSGANVIAKFVTEINYEMIY